MKTNVTKLPQPAARPAPQGATLASVLEAGKGQALKLQIDGREVPVLAHLARVGAISAGDLVLALELAEGYLVVDRLRRPGEAVAAELLTEEGRVVVNADQALTLRCGQSEIGLTADGRIRIDGREIYSFADDRLCLQGAVIELN
jgi:hypothetical protein